jgi:adenine phosphoribosyltransferase
VDTSPAARPDSAALAARVRETVRDVPDFPRPGILFKDITPVLADAALMGDVIRHAAAEWRPASLDAVAAIEARGFIFGGALAVELGIAFVPIRKPGKLPYRARRLQYALEYGTDAVEAHEDAFRPGDRVLLVDAVLATGGTAAAAATLVRELGGTILGASFLIELAFLHGRARLPDLDIRSLVIY